MIGEVTIGKQFANAVADHISREMFPPHRDVIEVRNPFGGCRCFVAFGNDGYRQDDRTRAYVDALLAELGQHDPVLGIESDEGYTWAIVVLLDEHNYHAPFFRAAMKRKLYAKYCESRGLADDDGFMLARKSICDRQIIEHTDREPLTINGCEWVNWN